MHCWDCSLEVYEKVEQNDKKVPQSPFLRDLEDVVLIYCKTNDVDVKNKQTCL